MPEIIIPISRFTKRIFDARYTGEEPYRITRSDETYHHLSAEPIRGSVCFTKLNKLLTEEVCLRVSSVLARRLRAKRRQIFIGEHLHKILQAKMLTFIEAQVLAEVPAQRALKNFLEMNGITEDDYSLETAYTAWKRYKQVFLPKDEETSAPFWSVPGPQNEGLGCAAPAPLPTPVDIVVRCTNNYFECGYVNLLCQPITIQPRERAFTYLADEHQLRAHSYERKVLAFQLYFHCQLTTEQITSIICRDVSRIRRYIQEISFQRTQYEEVRRDVMAIDARIELARTNLQAG